MRRYSQVLAPLVPHRIRIITQSVLDDATNERAGEILIQHFKSSAEWSRIPIALACSPIGVRAIASRTCLSPPHTHSVAHAVDNDDTYRRCFTATSPRTECTWRRVPPSHVTLHRSKTWAPSPSAQRLRYVDVTWGYCSCGPHALTEPCVAPQQYFREHHPYLWSPPDSPAPVPPRCTGANCVAEFGVLTWRVRTAGGARV